MTDTPSLGILPEGTIFLLSSGAYSDYSILALLRATQDLDLDKFVAGYLAANPEQVGKYKFKQYQFANELVASGMVEEIRTKELYIAEYATALFKLHEGHVT